MTTISPFLVVCADSVAFDYLSGSKIVRVRVQRELIDNCQGRRLSSHEASAIVRSRMPAIGRALVDRAGTIESALCPPLQRTEVVCPVGVTR